MEDQVSFGLRGSFSKPDLIVLTDKANRQALEKFVTENFAPHVSVEELAGGNARLTVDGSKFDAGWVRVLSEAFQTDWRPVN